MGDTPLAPGEHDPPEDGAVDAPETLTERTPPRLDAFISYSHVADGDLAPALRRGLHQLGKPWYRTRAAKDDLVGEDIRQHRRTRTIARAAVATLIVLLVAALVSAVIARANAVRGTW